MVGGLVGGGVNSPQTCQQRSGNGLFGPPSWSTHSPHVTHLRMPPQNPPSAAHSACPLHRMPPGPPCPPPCPQANGADMSAYTSAATLQVRRQIFLGKCPAAFRPRRADVVELMVVWSGLSKGRCPEHAPLQQAFFSWPRLSVPFAPDFDCRRRPGRQNSASIRTPTVGEASCVAANRQVSADPKEPANCT